MLYDATVKHSIKFDFNSECFQLIDRILSLKYEYSGEIKIYNIGNNFK